MPILFNQVPNDIRRPGFYAEVNAGPPSYTSASKALLIGKIVTGTLDGAGSLEPLVVTPVGSADPSDLCGYGSQLADMITYFREVNPIGELYVVGLTDGEGAVKAAGSVTFAGTVKRSGTFSCYIAGVKVSAKAFAGDTAATVAARFKTSINKNYAKFGRTLGMPVTAGVDGTVAGKVDITARHGGTEGNGIRIDKTLGGDPNRIPGIEITIVQMTGGSGATGLDEALAAIGASQFDWIGGTYNAAGNLDTIRDFMRQRWDPMNQLDGHYITAQNGSLATLTAYGTARNDPHVTILGLRSMPQPMWCWVAALTGQIANRKNLGQGLATANEIARPMHMLPLYGLDAPANPTNLFGPADQEALLRSGISTIAFKPDGQAECQRIITTYQVNDAGLEDPTFLDIEAIAITAYTKRYFRNAILGQFPRHAMREDSPTRVDGVVTPTEVRACLIHAYDQLFAAGVVREADLFARNVRVEFDFEHDRINIFVPVTKTAAARTFAVNLTLYLSQEPLTGQI